MVKKSKKNEAVPVDNQVGAVIDYGEYAGKGTEDFSQTEKGLPFLKILQATNPEVAGEGSVRIEGARAGMILNTGTRELFESITLVPAVRLHVIQEWQGRSLVGMTVMRKGDPYPDNYKEAVARQEADGRKFGDFWTGEPEKSTSLGECFQVFCVVMDGDEPVGMVVLPFSSTSIKRYKKQLSRRVDQLRGNPPLFARSIVLTTEKDSNDAGQTWFAPVVTFPVENNPVKSALPLDSKAFLAGAKLHELVTSGAIKADSKQDTREESAAGKTKAF